MAGAAKVYKELWIPASDFITDGSSNATSGSTYNALAGQHWHIRTLTPTADNAEANMTWAGIAPVDAATSGSVIPYIEVCPTTALAAGSDLAKPVLRYNYVAAGGASTTSGSVALLTATSIALGGLGVRQVLTMPNIPSFAQGQAVRFMVAFPANGASTTSGSYLGLVGLRLRYVSDRLGASGVS
jgi:hypothetical protein